MTVQDHERLTTAIAVDVLPWPPSVRGGLAEMTEEAELWPVLVVVVSEPQDRGSAQPLFDLLNGPARTDSAVVVGGRCDWAVLDPALALLRLTVRSEVPVRFGVEVLLPVGPVLDALGAAARGGMIGLTTRSRAARLAERPGTQDVLREIVLLGCRQPAHLAALANALRTRPVP